jgi:phosphorylase kinase alpha/beta subunit
MINEPLGNILNELRNSVGLYAKCQLYGILIKREGINYEINGMTGMIFLLPDVHFNLQKGFHSNVRYHFSVRDNLRALYQQAGSLRFWMAVRYCSSLLNHTVDSISPFITGVLVKGKQVMIMFRQV